MNLLCRILGSSHTTLHSILQLIQRSFLFHTKTVSIDWQSPLCFFFSLVTKVANFFLSIKRSWSGPDEWKEEEEATAAAAGTSRLQQVQDQKGNEEDLLASSHLLCRRWWHLRTCIRLHSCRVRWDGGVQTLRICANLCEFCRVLEARVTHRWGSKSCRVLLWGHGLGSELQK